MLVLGPGRTGSNAICQLFSNNWQHLDHSLKGNGIEWWNLDVCHSHSVDHLLSAILNNHSIVLSWRRDIKAQVSSMCKMRAIHSVNNNLTSTIWNNIDKNTLEFFNQIKNVAIDLIQYRDTYYKTLQFYTNYFNDLKILPSLGYSRYECIKEVEYNDIPFNRVLMKKIPTIDIINEDELNDIDDEYLPKINEILSLLNLQSILL